MSIFQSDVSLFIVFSVVEMSTPLGHFRNFHNRPCPSSPGLCIKTRLSAQPLIWKWFFILIQIKLIFTRKVVHLASFWKRGFLELGNGLFFHKDISNRWLYSSAFFPLITRLRDGLKLLVKSVCDIAPKSLFWALDLCSRIWVRAVIGLLKKAIVDLPIRLKGSSKCTSGNSLSPLWAQKKNSGAALQMLLTRVCDMTQASDHLTHNNHRGPHNLLV